MRTQLAAAVALVMGAGMATAQNPLVTGQFTADPTARVFNGRVYVYPSHDIPSPIERLKEWFCMADYHVFSSDNLTDWTDHGVIVSQERVPWVEPESYSMWAPDCVERDGRYYFFFPSTPKGPGERKGFGVGVAVSDNPAGPFFPMPRPIKGVFGIDPSVIVASDGQAYIYWAAGRIFVAKLSKNMMELESEPQICEGLPEGFKEGPFAFERNGKFYLTFPWVRTEGSTETLAYAMSDSPMGPWDFKGLIMEESPTGCWTNHHSIVEFEGQNYLFYHHNDYSPEFDKNRSIRADELTFNEDGTINLVKATLRGVGITRAESHIEVDRYSEISAKGASIDYLNPDNKFDGWKTIMSKGGWVRYNKVDFGQQQHQTATVCVRSKAGAQISIEVGGKEAARIKVAKSQVWTNATANLKYSPQGVQDIVVKVVSGSAEIDWAGFDCMPWTKGGFETGKYRNVFAEMGHSEAEINAKLQEVFDDVFVNEKTRCYFEVGDDMAYVSDVKNNDVRTEGMSYGMMIAVQMDRKDIFDRLWRWCQKYMQHHDGPQKGYFAWSCKTDGTRNAQGPASDGELYYVTSLIFAGNRWGDTTGIDYHAEARNILDCSMLKQGMDHVTPFINVEKKLITFTPSSYGSQFTDPSYHLPAFYEVWARWAGDGRSAFWRECAKASREYLHKSVNAQTGLTPDYNNYDGSLMNTGHVLGDAFRYDSWRVPMNIALDYSWSCADGQWQREYANTIQNFLYKEGIDTFLDQYNVDGTTPTDTLRAGSHAPVLRHSLGLVATSAAATLACTHAKGREFVDRLWNSKLEPYSDGFIDVYYDSLLRLFAFMHLSGNYRVIPPQQ